MAGSQHPSTSLPIVPPANHAPPGVNMRAWFAGLALGNPEVMKDVPIESRVEVALRIADEMLAALVPKVPSAESMAAPSEADMAKWDEEVASRNLATVPPPRRPRPPSKVPTEPGIPAPAKPNGAAPPGAPAAKPVPQTVSPPSTRYKWSTGFPRSNRPPVAVQRPQAGAGAYSVINDK